MKRILSKTIIILLCSHASLLCGQSFYGFSWNGTGIEWQKVFDTDTSTTLTDLINSSKLTEYKIINETTVIGTFPGVTATCDGTESRHKSDFSMTAWAKGVVTGTAKIELKEGRYRITAYSLQIDPRKRYDDTGNEPLESNYWNINKGDFHKDWRRDDLICFDNGLTKLFEVKGPDNW